MSLVGVPAGIAVDEVEAELAGLDGVEPSTTFTSGLLDDPKCANRAFGRARYGIERRADRGGGYLLRDRFEIDIRPFRSSAGAWRC